MRQYIGARYTPKFMGNYDATQTYEALSVVDNGLGTTYITKIPTPAGTPLTDTTYWAIYGASSGAIINLQNQIDDMKDGSLSGSLQNQITNEVNIRKRLINVLDYGADPTGNTDSTSAFNAAFAALPNTNEFTPGGNGFYIPSGTYAINNELDFTSKPVEIFGDGKNATRIVGWGSADPDSGYPTYFRVKRANIHDIWFEGDNQNCVGVRYVGGHTDNFPNTIQNCMFWNCLMAVQ